MMAIYNNGFTTAKSIGKPPRLNLDTTYLQFQGEYTEINDHTMFEMTFNSKTVELLLHTHITTPFQTLAKTECRLSYLLILNFCSHFLTQKFTIWHLLKHVVKSINCGIWWIEWQKPFAFTVICFVADANPAHVFCANLFHQPDMIKFYDYKTK